MEHLYLKSDILLLADVFENFRKTCLEYYKLDPCHYFTSPRLSWDAMLKMTDIKLDLMTDIDMFQFIEKGMRGGISYIANRYGKANNTYMKTYNEKAPSKYIMYLDANNLYGWAMIPQPVMEVVVKKTKLDESGSPRGGAGVKCLLYEARKQPNYDPVRENTFKSELSTLDPNMGFAQMSEGTSSTDLTNSKFGKCPVGSIMSYQTSFTESNFSAVANLTSVPRNNAAVNAQELNYYPRFPLCNDNDMVVPRELSDTEEALIKHLTVHEDRIHSIESTTREQAGCDEWKSQRTYRFTASKFHLISRRQRNHQSFAQSLMHTKPFSSKYVTHGLKYEPIALQQYEKFMFNRKTPVAVLKSGFVVSKSCPVLGASPDAKVVDFGCSLSFGLAEVKCPYTKFHVTPLEACSDPTFFMEKSVKQSVN